MLCSYGCRQEAEYKFKNGKWCCSKNIASCPNTRKKMRISHEDKSNGLHSEETKKKIGQSKIGKKRKPFSKEWKKNLSLNHRDVYGKNNPMFGKRPSEKCIQINREKMLSGQAIYMNSFPRDPEKWKKKSEKQRQKMLDGGAHIALKGIKNPSRDELKLRQIVKELYCTSEHTYRILNYDVDNALVEHKIVIEFDGWFHFDTEEHKEYHKKRQEKIEEGGWKFLRYNIFQKFPTKEQVKKDIDYLIGGNSG